MDTNPTTQPTDPACFFCGGDPDVETCHAFPCTLNPHLDGDPGPGCTFFPRWLSSHCYGCGRHFTATEIAAVMHETHVGW